MVLFKYLESSRVLAGEKTWEVCDERRAKNKNNNVILLHLKFEFGI